METTVEPRAEGVGSTIPVYPLLFAAYPVLRLYEQNLAAVEPGDVVMPLLVVLGVTAIGWAALTALLRDPRRAAVVTAAVVLPVMLFGLLVEAAAPLLGDQRLVLVAIVVVFVAAAVFVALRAGPRLGTITLGLNVISIVLVLLVAIPVGSAVASIVSEDSGPDSESSVDAQGEATADRDIYHFVLDRYGSESALETGFGLSNAEFVAWLRDNGFQVKDDARANYTKTTLSLASTLGMEHLDDLAARQGADSENLAPIVRRIKRSKAGAFLQSLGYEYIHIGSWFNQTRKSAIADRTYNPDEEVSFATTLYDLSILPVLVDRPEPTNDFKRKHADAANYQFDLLDEIVDEKGPKYVFAHILVPHPPYVFLADGTYDPEGATFETQLADTNRRVRDLLEPLLALPEERRPIIIVQADEGPFPKRYAADEKGFDWAAATDDELVTKYGVLNAMLLPGEEGADPLRDGMTLINTYPELFNRYFDADIEDLSDRSYASNKATPYGLFDITDRLDVATDGD